MRQQIELNNKTIRQLTTTQRKRLQQLMVGRESYMATILRDNPQNACCWLAEENHRIVAWSLLRWFRPEVQAPHNAYISVFVEPQHRRRGLGRWLVQKAMAHCPDRNMHPCFFGAHQAQRTFYLSCGAPETSITPHAFPRTYWAHYRFVKNGLRE